MIKNIHEIRDPIHVFVRMDTDERKVLNSRAFQRLRHIHQLALSYLVYPGASHKRFEHSLGVMELSGRVFDIVTHPDSVSEQIRKILPEIAIEDKKRYWRRVIRMAALCHDIGHLPFSHAAEKQLLPDGWDHERLTKEIILCEEMQKIWSEMTPPIRPEDIVKLAVGPKSAAMPFSSWEAILSEIIVGDAFGVDRMDYLLRDSHHIGVSYGKFDHYRLIDTLRILVSPYDEENARFSEPVLGVTEGGIQSAEALLLARYFMYSQVYFHPIRRIYDIHLMDFLKDYLPDGKFSTVIDDHLQITDHEIIASMLDAARNSSKRGHKTAKRITDRRHFRILYERNPDDIKINPEAGQAVYEALLEIFGDENLRHDKDTQKGSAHNFPVLTRDGRIVSSMEISEALNNLPLIAVDYVFIAPEHKKDAEAWLQKNRERIIAAKFEEEA